MTRPPAWTANQQNSPLESMDFRPGNGQSMTKWCWDLLSMSELKISSCGFGIQNSAFWGPPSKHFIFANMSQILTENAINSVDSLGRLCQWTTFRMFLSFPIKKLYQLANYRGNHLAFNMTYHDKTLYHHNSRCYIPICGGCYRGVTQVLPMANLSVWFPRLRRFWKRRLAPVRSSCRKVASRDDGEVRKLVVIDRTKMGETFSKDGDLTWFNPHVKIEWVTYGNHWIPLVTNTICN
jgi:hypothetical protein